MKYFVLIFVLLLAYIIENKYLEKFSINLNNCKKTKVNDKLIPPINTSWNNQIIQEPVNFKNSLKLDEQCKDECIEGFLLKPYIWVYVETDISSRFWKNFYTRKSVDEVCKSSLRKVAKIRFGRSAAVKVYLQHR